MRFFTRFARDERGATAIEYGLIAALIAVAAITAMGNIGTNLNKTFNNVSTSING
jgi:pilus assembly protein Flp/PilA